MRDLLALTADLPERRVPAATTILREGDESGEIWVLVDGHVTVRRGGLTVASITEPGAPFGEMAALLGGPSSATVETAGACVFRVAEDGAGWLADHGAVVIEVARTLARRLDAVTGYLADLRDQYADADTGLGMIDRVLAALVTQEGPRARPGSARDPDPLY